MRRRIEAVEIAEQESRGIADTSIGVRDALEDLVGNGHLVAVVGRSDPQAQNIRA